MGREARAWAVAPSASAWGAGAMLVGLAAGSGLPVASPGLAVLLAGLALAAPPVARRVALPLAIGWILGGRPSVVPPAAGAAFDPRRPVAVVAHQVEDWRPREGRWHCRVRIEVVRQGPRVVRWPETVGWSWPGPGPPRGSRWRLRGRLGRPAALGHGGPARPPPWFLQVKSERLVEPLPDAGWRREAARHGRRLRGRLRAAFATAAAGTPAEDLALALVLGDASALPERHLRALRRAGLAHVVALSGLHLGVVAGWCALAARALPRGARVLVVALGTAAYVVVGGGRPSLLRAWWMVNAGAAALLAGRPARSLHALAWAASALVAWRPEHLADTGFRLTFAATAGVIVGLRIAARRRHPIVSAVAATVGAQVATLPITAAAFHWLPTWSWAWNLVLLPAVALAVPACLVWSLAAWAAPALAAAAAPALAGLAGWMALPARVPAGWLGGVPWTPELAWLLVAVAALAALAAAPAASRGRRAARAVVAAGLAAGLALLVSTQAVRPPGGAVARFLDVGQGDAALLGDGPAAMLIDGGGWRGPGVAEKALLPVLARAGVRRLEVAAVSHGDLDHCRGVVELADYLPIEEVWMAPGTALSKCGLELARRPGLRVVALWEGARPVWRDWRFRVLGPPPGARAGGNEDSLVLRADSRGRSVLFTGDIGHATEFRLLQRLDPRGADVTLLKIAHHGSAASSSTSFLRAARPRLAVLSVGALNPFGHPDRRVLARLDAAGVPVLRTDRTGLVEVRWRGTEGWRLATPAAPGDGLQ